MGRRIFSRCIAGLAALVVLGLTAASCSQDSDTTAQPRPAADLAPRSGGRLVVGIAGDADGFLPTINRWTSSSLMVARSIFDPLAAFDENGKPQPYLASTIMPNADFTEWTIGLRANVTFHDDTPLDAQAVAAHLRAMTESPIVKPALTYVQSVTPVDELTVKVSLKAPWAHLPDMLATQVGYVTAPTQHDAVQAIGTGPFRLVNWVPGQPIVTLRNERYWRRDSRGNPLPYLGQIEFRPIPDEKQRSAALRSGDIDLLQTEGYSDIRSFGDQVRTDPNGPVRMLVDQSQGTEASIVLNCQAGPFSDPLLRKAAAHAVDREGLVADLFDNSYELANGPFTKSSPWGQSDRFPAYDPERARQYVSAWRSGHGNQAPRVRLSAPKGTDNAAIAQFVAHAWQQAGFTVDLRLEEEKAISVLLVTGGTESTGRNDALFVRYFDKPDPDSMFHYFVSSNIAPPNSVGLNYARYGSEVVDDAMEKARGSTDETFRAQQYQRVWDDFADNVPILWLFHSKWAIVHSASVHNVGNATLPDGGKAEPVTWGNLFLSEAWVE